MEAALSKRRSGPTLYLFFGFLPRSKAEQSEQTPFFKASSPSHTLLISALSLVSFHPFIGEQAEEWRWQVMYGRWHYSSMPSPVPVPQVPAAWARAVWMGGALSLPWEPLDVEVRGQVGIGKILASFRCQDGAPRCLDIKVGAGGDWPWGCPEFRSGERRDRTRVQ